MRHSNDSPPVIASIRWLSAGPTAQHVNVPGSYLGPASVVDELNR